MTIRTRFAPSPTGFLHIGGLRTALFCWLYARGRAGRYVLRIEDTDLERSTPEAIQQILDGLAWAGLAHDEGPFYQTQRFDRYREVLDELLAQGRAYRCYCTKEELEQMRNEQIARGQKPRYDGRCRERSAPREGIPPVVRFKNPTEGSVVVNDVVHGPVEFQNRELDDLIIARSDGSPTYNFCVVVDDMDMRITHVIRGDDHLNNTPRQMNMLTALGYTPPVYAHLPMILGPDGTKLSKRHGAVSVLQYRDDGFLPEALLNYLVRLGWSHGDQEVFSIEEMIRLFDIADVNKSAAAFDPEKLAWLNQQHLMRVPLERLIAPLREQLAHLSIDAADDAQLMAIAAVQRERAKTLKEMAANSLFFFRAPERYEAKATRKHVTAEVLRALEALIEDLRAVSDWSAPTLHALLHAQCERHALSLGKIAQPLRLAVSGGTVSPPIDATLAILGKVETLRRVERALSAWRADLFAQANRI
ncbi:MAG TPA: glutamate--tRNA ligase [Steroidobacteraceae bacterium]|nr:glutamate--tRNA ligase [Steroidobacteraceae bacterium]